MKYTWDDEKAATNLDKHGVSFAEAVTVCENQMSTWSIDWEHGEVRHNVVGHSNASRVLYVVVLERREDHLHIISARKATKHERKNYEKR